jgi:hypothetical protein
LGCNSPSYTGGETPLRLPALALWGYLHFCRKNGL